MFLGVVLLLLTDLLHNRLCEEVRAVLFGIFLCFNTDSFFFCTFKKIHLFIYCLFIGEVCKNLPQHLCDSQGTACENQVSPPIRWVWGMKLRLPNSAASAFTH